MAIYLNKYCICDVYLCLVQLAARFDLAPNETEGLLAVSLFRPQRGADGDLLQ